MLFHPPFPPPNFFDLLSEPWALGPWVQINYEASQIVACTVRLHTGWAPYLLYYYYYYKDWREETLACRRWLFNFCREEMKKRGWQSLFLVEAVGVLFFLLLGNAPTATEADHSVSAFVQNSIFSNKIVIFSKSYCAYVSLSLLLLLTRIIFHFHRVTFLFFFFGFILHNDDRFFWIFYFSVNWVLW